jgi:alpha-L-rhamnosidase
MRSCLLFFALAAACTADPVHLLCNHLENPLGLDTPKPRLSWQSNNTERNWHQSSYEILVASSETLLQQGRGDVWDSGKVSTSQSTGVVYSGPALTSRARYFWTVKVWDRSDRPSGFAPPAWWEMGLLAETDWQGKWIARVNPQEAPDRAAMKWLALPQGAQDLPPNSSGTFRKQFQLASLPESAAFFVIGRGDFVAVINGNTVARKADWGDFDRKDVTKELVIGLNTIELRLTSHEVSPWAPKADHHPTAIAALLKMRNADGTMTRLGTDEGWGKVAGDLPDSALIVPGPLPQPAALFRHDFEAEGKVTSARLYVSALGSYRVSINGQAPSADVMTPDFTDYKKHLEYQSYDVTRLLKPGGNAIGLTLGDGWYSSPLTWEGSHLWPPPNRVMAQLEIRYEDGKRTTISTNEDWRTDASPIEFSQIYAGEDYDARNEKPGWDLPNFSDQHWSNAIVGAPPTAKLVGLLTAPVHVNSELKPVKVSQCADGRYVFDFGQNMVGWVQLKVKGQAGTRVRMRFAEILKPDGTIYTQNLRNADATDTYTLRGGAEETYSPTFTSWSGGADWESGGQSGGA